MFKAIILLIISFLIQTPMTYSQILTDSYLKVDCDISESYEKEDTIFAFKADNCGLSQIKINKNGIWIIRSKKDSALIIESFQIVGNKLEGIRYLKNDKGESFYINYLDGKYNGPFMHLSSSNKLILFVNYLNGNPSGDYYYYSYNNVNDKLLSISRYDKNGKLKHKEFIGEKKLFNKKETK